MSALKTTKIYQKYIINIKYLKYLWKLMKVAWDKGIIPKSG